MPTEHPPPEAAAATGPADKDTPQPCRLAPAAERALAEAAARRAEHERLAAARPKEVNGPSGLDPTRYGDWEINGIASDF